jgi:hypothetical protein
LFRLNSLLLRLLLSLSRLCGTKEDWVLLELFSQLLTKGNFQS